MAGKNGSQGRLLIEAREDEYSLLRIDEQGKRTDFAMSERDLVYLERALPHVLKKIASTRARDGVTPIVAVPVADIRLRYDRDHAKDLLMTTTDEFGHETGFVVPLTIARRLLQELQTKIARLT